MRSRAGSSTLVGEWQEISRVDLYKHMRALPWLKHSQHPSHLASGLFNYIFNMKSEIGSLAHYHDLISDLFFVVNIWIIIWVVGYCRLFPVRFHIAEVQTCWYWTSYYLYLPICTASVNHFVVSVCPLYLLFFEGFECHWQSRILINCMYIIKQYWGCWRKILIKSKSRSEANNCLYHPPNYMGGW